MNNNFLVSVNGVSVTRNRRNILLNASLDIQPEEIVTLIGPNGAGKTTLVRVILDLIKPDKGSVTRQKNLSIGYMPQKLQIEASLPLNVKRFLSLAGGSTPQILSTLEQVGARQLLDYPMQSLSGGETQRVLLARALLRKPQLLVLDEPVQGVDVMGQEELYRQISDIRHRYHCGVLMVSHDLHLVMAATDTVVCLNQHICCKGHPEKVTHHPAYLELFGKTTQSNIALYTHHHDHAHDIHGNIHEQSSRDNGHA